MAYDFSNQASGGTHGGGGQLAAVAAQNRSRGGMGGAPPAAVAGPDGVTREGRGYDNVVAQLQQPYGYTMTNPDGSTSRVPFGGPLNQAPQWNQNAGPGGVYMNRLDTSGQATPGATMQAANAQLLGQLGTNFTPRELNASAAGAQGAQYQARLQQQAAIPGLMMAGQDNRLAQQQIAAMGGAQDAVGAGFQGNALGMYQAAAEGRGPSAAQAQLTSALGQNIAAQRAQAASVRGGGAAAAMRQAGQTGAQLALQTQAQAAALRAAEQQAGMAGLANTAAQARQSSQGATQTLGGLYGGARAQDIGQAGQVADYVTGMRGQDIQAGGTFGGLQNQQTALDDARGQDALKMAALYEQLRQQGVMGQNATNLQAAGLENNYYLGGRGLTLQHDAAQDAAYAQAVGSIANGAGGLLMYGLGGGIGGGAAAAARGGGGIGPSVDSALASFDNAHQQPGMF